MFLINISCLIILFRIIRIIVWEKEYEDVLFDRFIFLIILIKFLIKLFLVSIRYFFKPRISFEYEKDRFFFFKTVIEYFLEIL